MKIIHNFARSCTRTPRDTPFSRMDHAHQGPFHVRRMSSERPRRFSHFFFICRCCRRPSTKSNTLLAILSSHVSNVPIYGTPYKVQRTKKKNTVYSLEMCAWCVRFYSRKMDIGIRRSASNQIELKTKTTATDSILGILPNLMDDKFHISLFFVEQPATGETQNQHHYFALSSSSPSSLLPSLP